MLFVCFLFLAGLPLWAERPCRHLATESVDLPDSFQRADLSGLVRVNNRLFTVSDLSHQNDIYEIVLRRDKGAYLRTAVALDPEALERFAHATRNQGRVDFEGLCHDGSDFLIASESTRSLIRVQKSGDFANLQLSYQLTTPQSMNPFSGVSNAGLEAVACDSDNPLWYVFNERQFRMGYTMDSNTRQATNQFDFPSHPDLPSRHGSLWMYPDFAGADLQASRLYVLERNGRRILKVDPIEQKRIDSCSYQTMEDGLYKEPGPFGLAEGLAVGEESMWIVLDNNGHSRKQYADDRRPVLLQLGWPR